MSCYWFHVGLLFCMFIVTAIVYFCLLCFCVYLSSNLGCRVGGWGLLSPKLKCSLFDLLCVVGSHIAI